MSTTAIKGALPPGPSWPGPMAWCIVNLGRTEALRRAQRRYGDIFTVKLPGGQRSVIIAGPELIKRVYTAKPDVLVTAEDGSIGEMLGPGSLFSLDGKPHLEERKLLLPSFHGERMRTFESVIEEETSAEIATWPEGVEFATMPSFMRITLNAILRAVFGADGPHQRQLAEILPRLVTVSSILTLVGALRRDLGPRSPGRTFRRLRVEYDGVIDSLIDVALADPDLDERPDVLALLLGAHYEDGSSMSRSAIADELLTLLAAGHETTATSLAWAIERLRRNPGVLARLEQEAEGQERTLRAATINEVQRTRPVVAATSRRVAAEEFELDGWQIPRGHWIIEQATLVHTDPRFFTHPERFEPDRFLDRAPQTYNWIPFGGGTRRCPGAAFAQMEMDVVLRTLLRTFRLRPTTAREERWRPRGVAFAPSKGGVAVVDRRAGTRRGPVVGMAEVA